MTSPPLTAIRNIGIISHIDAGKTTVSERILYYTGEIHRMGEVHDGATTMDWMDQEQERGITITATSTTCRWRDIWINLIDTPGHIDFTIEVERSLRVLDGTVVIFSAVEGVQPQSESVWRQADHYRVPRICLINKLDRTGADYRMVLEQMRRQLGARPVLLQLPVGEEHAFAGVIDLLDETLLTFDEADQGVTVTSAPLPPELLEAVAAARQQVVEVAADYDDGIMEDFLDGRPVAAERLRAALRRGTLHDGLCPVFLGSALRNKGIQPVLDGVRNYLPAPADVPPPIARHPDHGSETGISCSTAEPFCALAFKVVADEGRKLAYLRIYSGELKAGDLLLNPSRHNARERAVRLFRMHARRREAIETASAGEIVAVGGLREVLTGDTLCAPHHPLLLAGLDLPEPVVSLAVEARGAQDRERLPQALERLQWEDPTFLVREDAETGQTILTGMGELHLEVMVERLRREYGVEVKTGRPQVVYRETITAAVERREIFQREADGKSHYGEVLLRIEPLPRGSGLRFAVPPDDAVGSVPPEWRQPLTESLRQACGGGVLGGYPLTDLQARILEWPFTPGVTTEIGLRAAIQRGLSLALREAAPLLLEPLMSLEVTVPTEYAGRVLGSLQQKRGRIEGMTVRDHVQIIRAQAPLAELFGFMTELRSATKGHGSFTMEFASFDSLGKV